jgi:Protein of unknown function (DUF1524)
VIRAAALRSLAILALTTGCQLQPPGADPRPGATSAPGAGPVPSAGTAGGLALSVLERLPVKGRSARTGYSREAFGPAWADVDQNGCDTRNDILRRDLVAITDKPGTRGCVVLSGVLHDPYTRTDVPFLRGQLTSADVQIDHVVALSNAWQTGAARLSAQQRRQLANDPLELIAVSGQANKSKGDADAATWLPPAKGYRCAYVARQIAVKVTYGLWVTRPERAAFSRILGGCPGQRIPAAVGLGRPDPAA